VFGTDNALVRAKRFSDETQFLALKGEKTNDLRQLKQHLGV
jgi:hypothetical protein